MPRIRHLAALGEVYLRTGNVQGRERGYVSTNPGLFEWMAGVAVPVFDANGQVVAASSAGTLTARLEGDRLQVVVEMPQREARGLVRLIIYFDRTLRRPKEGLFGPARSS